MSRIEYEDLSPEQINHLTDGCGNSFMNVPDLAFGQACRVHDFGYWRGGTFQDRADVDLGWYLAMTVAADNYSLWARNVLKWAAWIYYKAVRIASWYWWPYSKVYKTMDDLTLEMMECDKCQADLVTHKSL